jgi:type IX secretion system PorP/SprF family membrane protein
MRTVVLYIIMTSLFCGYAARAQDPHFSQYFSSPLTFNPALTGYFDGKHRAAATIRRQWANSSDPITTGTLSFDTKILPGSIGSNDRWGLGLLAVNDRSAGDIFKSNYFTLSTGFNKGLDADGGQTIGIGVQATFAQKSIDFSRLSFGNQFAGNGYDLSISSGESIRNSTVSYADLNAGILYNYRDENNNRFSFGGSMYHILRPNLSFFCSGDQTLQSRYTIHAGANLSVQQRDQLFISTHVMQQAGASEMVFGGAYGLAFADEGNYLYLGSWLRTGDAIYPYIGIYTNTFQLGLSYDVTISDLRKTKGFSGGAEISFIYHFNKPSGKGLPCFF